MRSPSVVTIVPWNGCSTPAAPAGGLDEPDRGGHGGRRIVLEPERQREVEQQLGVRLALDRREQRRIDVEQEVALDGEEVVDEAVVHEQPAAVTERVAVRPLDGRAARRADVGEEQRRRHVRRDLAQVRVVPRGRRSPRKTAGVAPAPYQPTPKPSPLVVSAPSRECRLWSMSECAGA